MKILHVILANPHNHHGGMHNYCDELMSSQQEMGDEVYLLYPGEWTPSKKLKIVPEQKKKNYRIQNALPVPITFGIDNPDRYISCSATVKATYKEWLKKITPEIIHMHSFMGIHKEFMEAAKELSIPIVFTTHDYYPICFKCNLVDSEGNNCDGRAPDKCAYCNANAGLSPYAQLVMSSRLYEKIKSSWLISIIKNLRWKRKSIGVSSKEIVSVSTTKVEAFTRLARYYAEMMQLVTAVHCNSPMTQQYYSRYFPDIQYISIPITSGRIIRRKRKECVHRIIRFAYMGGDSVYKGYYKLLEALAELDKMGLHSWEMELYGGQYGTTKSDGRVHYRGQYRKEDIGKVYEDVDALVVPSQCPETFCLVVLEALANGVPVICSDLVGSKYLVENIEEALVFSHADSSALANSMARLFDTLFYSDIINKINAQKLPLDIRAHAEQIRQLYKALINQEYLKQI